MSAVFILGIQAALLALFGLAGDYVQRIYRQSSGRPFFLVRRVHEWSRALTIRRLDTCRSWRRRSHLVARYPFKSYRNYRVLPRKAQNAVMLAEIDATLKHPDGLVLHVASGDAQSLAVGRALAWDSAFFGVPMARVDYLLASERELARTGPRGDPRRAARARCPARQRAGRRRGHRADDAARSHTAFA